MSCKLIGLFTVLSDDCGIHIKNNLSNKVVHVKKRKDERAQKG